MSGREVVDLTDVDLFVRGEHHAAFDILRRRENLHWNPYGGAGFWALTRYDEVAQAYLDHQTFSSSGGAMLGGSFHNEADTAAGRMLVASDPPRHRLLRHEMHTSFAPSVINNAQTRIVELVHRAVDRLVADGGGEFANDIATELPAGVLMAMLGVGHVEARRLIELTRHMIGYRDPIYRSGDKEERVYLASVQGEIFDFFQDLIDERRGSSGNDLVSWLLSSRINGRPMPDEDVLYNCMNVAVGGNETSSYSACSGLEALMSHPSEYDEFLGGETVTDTFIDEVLRWSSTNAYVQRIVVAPVTIRGTAIRSGDVVTLWNVSANRDESRFPGASTFRIGRSPNRHLSFGAGIHRCIGAGLGRTELQVVFDYLAHRRVRLVPQSPPTRLRSNFILGTTRMPVEVHDAVPAGG